MRMNLTLYITDQPLGMTGPGMVTISPWWFAAGLGILSILFLLLLGRLPGWQWD